MTGGLTPPRTGRLSALDWRFLLPGRRPFRSLALLGGREADAELVTEIGLAERVRLDLDAPADAVAVLHTATASVEDVSRSLLPGGVVYWEVARRRQWRRTPHRLRTQLLAAGLTPAATYGVLPDLRRPTLYTPLEEPGAFQWFLSTLFHADTPARWCLARLLQGRIGRSRRGAEVVMPCYAVVAVNGTPEPPGLLSHPALPAALQGRLLRPLMLTWARDDASRVAILPFQAGAPKPSHVLKVARRGGDGRSPAADQAVLSALSGRLQRALRGTIPEPVGTFEWSGCPVGVETCVPGRLLMCEAGEWGAPLRRSVGAFQRVVSWLTEFHRSVQEGVVEWDPEAAEQRLRAYESALGVTEAEEVLFAAARARSQALRGHAFPLVWAHYDLNGVNTFVGERHASVIDWEYASPGWPLVDLLHLAANWSQTVRRARTHAERVEDYGSLFFSPIGRHPLSEPVRTAIRRYLAALVMEPSFLPLMQVLLQVSRATWYTDAAGEQPGGRMGNPYVDYIRCLADAQGEDRLFVPE